MRCVCSFLRYCYIVKIDFVLAKIAVLQSPVQSFRGENLDFPLCTIPTVSLYEKHDFFENTILLVERYCRNSTKGKFPSKRLNCRL